jgi:hypothetical protein
MLFGANNRPRQATHVAFCGKCEVLLVSSRATGRLLLGLAAWSGSGSSVYS